MVAKCLLPGLIILIIILLGLILVFLGLSGGEIWIVVTIALIFLVAFMLWTSLKKNSITEAAEYFEQMLGTPKKFSYKNTPFGD